ncbi:cyclase family protein [Cochleicola gelatinilyticus]|uniref:Metal-dependent hydrolase n=1 Tax=Cochleicola gelatinilyticus TaxID=1763537 RepID=A0A167IQN9_9FLAO|nr:cyclase family protein [Cochleicola gelatinilyticus]OAB79915.1 metal-dependent hydrolase [Cochleicola gelatinilyticus]
MHATFKINDTLLTADLSKPLDISIPLCNSEKNPLAWYLEAPKIEPVKLDNWVGKVSEGASVNFNTIMFNPHAHGTHTECVGHISKEFHSVNEALQSFFFHAKVISVVPETIGEDAVIPKSQIEKVLNGTIPEALIIRTLPNTASKKHRHYSHTNWPYLHEEAALLIRELGIQHLLIDLPSVDKEKDEGALLAHKAFWNYPEAPRYQATISELIYVPNSIQDGEYLLNLQIAPFHNDAAPSKPILYTYI